MVKTVVMVLAAVTLGVSPALSADNNCRYELYMPDGQPRSLPVRIYVNSNIDWSMEPKLTLIRATDTVVVDSPLVVAPNQTWTRKVRGQEVACTGTLFIFDLSSQSISWYKSMTRVIPRITWTERSGEAAEPKQAVSEHDVYLANLPGAIILTVILTAVFVWIVALWSRGKAPDPQDRRFTELLRGVTGRYSLSHFQICAWTIAIGGMVAMYGLVKLQVPDIPETLVALMGMSFTTSGISYTFTDKRRRDAPREAPRLSDLIMNIKVEEVESTGTDQPADQNGGDQGAAASPSPDSSSDKGEAAKGAADRTKSRKSTEGQTGISKAKATRIMEEVSVPRTQMLFWTIILLVLFLFKSVVSGELWDVPWSMVALMGISQTGYLAPKYSDQKEAEVARKKKEQVENQAPGNA